MVKTFYFDMWKNTVISLVYVCMYLCMYMWHALVKRRTIQTWNLVLIQTSYKNSHVVWFEKVTPSAARLEKLPCHVDFPHISSIALFVYLFICVTSPDQPKNDSDLKFDTYSHWPYLKNCFFFVFSKKSPWRPLASKNCRVTWFFAYLLDCLVYLFVPRLLAKRKTIQTWNLVHTFP